MKTRCTICPTGCELSDGEVGDCHVRENRGGSIHCITFNRPASVSIDPVEKKPLYHFLPGTPTLSVGTAGCNLHCKQCQNWELSQSSLTSPTKLTPDDIAQAALDAACPSISYTYAEPLVSYEFTKACCETAARVGIKNVLVTAAYINPQPLRALCRHVDAANVDLKSFSSAFYREICGAELGPVLNALKIMKEMDVMVEITNLLIPTLNDSEEETRQLSAWVVQELGPETPLHFTRFYPRHQLKDLSPTPVEILLRAREIAMENGASHVYVGNITDRVGESTWCPGCGSLLVERTGYSIQSNLTEGSCPSCARQLHGLWH